MPMLEVPIEYLHERLTLDAITGELRWKAVPVSGSHHKTWNARYAGKIAGARQPRGYLGVCLLHKGKKRIFKAHRIVFAMLNGRWPDNIDHENRTPSDNRPSNLREVTHAQNMQNMVGRGYKPHLNRYVARIVVNGRQKHLGCFNTKEEARQVYLDAKKYYHPFYATVGG